MQAIDAKRLFLGAAGAAALGLAIGGVLRPNLALQTGSTEMTASPQAEFNEVALATAYPGGVPDYVIGTDWLPRNEAAITRALAETASQAAPEPDYEPPLLTVAHADSAEAHGSFDDAAAREPVAYPSESGDILAGLHPVEPQASADDGDEPAPPAV